MNSIAWAPHEYGLMLACASSDGKLSILHCNVDDGIWGHDIVSGHSIGVNSVSWAPCSDLGSVVQTQPQAQITKRFASGGCDNLIKILSEKEGHWIEENILEGHTDWVRDVAFAPSIGLGKTYLASCSQDKTVLIWTQEQPGDEWKKRLLKEEPFPDVVWRVSWSVGGNMLAVSCGDNKVTLWKENIDGVFAQVGDVNEA